jgi:pimeloyl-ACP methyl ester carboxylesterase
MTFEKETLQRFLTHLRSREILLRLCWEEWLSIGPPYPNVTFSVDELTLRFERNGYEWDMHGSFYTPDEEVDEKRAFVLFHGGAGSEILMDHTPDGRPGFGRVLASQGFKVLTLTYPGHYPPGGVWELPVPERKPFYLIDQDLPLEEIHDRNWKCTFNTILQGAGMLTDRHLTGREIFAFGHSTGGPMAAHLARFSKETTVIGLVGFGSGGPDGWRKEWREKTGAEPYKEVPLEKVSRRSSKSFREQKYEDPSDLTPWGGAEEYMQWADRIRSQMKTSLCDNQHRGAAGILEEYSRRTGLSLEEYLDHLQDPDPAWLRTIRVLLLVGENDNGHWIQGERVEEKREMFMGTKYAASTRGAHVVLVPRYGHVGYVERYNEKFPYLWLWAVKSGYFDR